MLILAAMMVGCTTAGAPTVTLSSAPTPPPSETQAPVSAQPAPTPAPASTTTEPPAGTPLASVGQASSGPARTTNPATPRPTPTPNPNASPPNGTITLDDNGGSFTLAVGDRFLLKLDTGFDWTVLVDDPSVVDRVWNITVVQGALGVYEARAPGTTTLTATGDPPCRKSTPACGAPSILFQVTLLVR